MISEVISGKGQMQNKIQYSPMAMSDLDEIWNYIANELLNPSAAENTVNGIMDVVDGLEGFPETGSRLIFDSELDSGYRFVIYKNYMAFYHTQADIIYIDRVMYGKRDYMTKLFLDDFTDK